MGALTIRAGIAWIIVASLMALSMCLLGVAVALWPIVAASAALQAEPRGEPRSSPRDFCESDSRFAPEPRERGKARWM
jgi:hypothetical protein